MTPFRYSHSTRIPSALPLGLCFATSAHSANNDDGDDAIAAAAADAETDNDDGTLPIFIYVIQWRYHKRDKMLILLWIYL